MDATLTSPPNPQRRPWQFSLRRLFVWMAAAALVLALFGSLLRAIQQARGLARQSACQGHFKQLVLALHNYHDHYGTFPPAYVADARGKPLHSWRVLILPYLEEQALYARYDFSLPWNAPANLQLAAHMPRIYRCQHVSSQQGPEITNYVAIVGPGTAWPGKQASRLEEFTDGIDETLIIVESHDSGICWLEPRDLELSSLPLAINPRGQAGISSLHSGGAGAALADGSLRLLPAGEMTPQRLKAMLTIAAGDTP